MRKELKEMIAKQSPYYESTHFSLQALGFIDAQRKCLPKAIGFAPELAMPVPEEKGKMLGEIVAVKMGGYGFILGDDGEEYFVHVSAFVKYVKWDNGMVEKRVKFRISPSETKTTRNSAIDVEVID